MYVVTTIIFMLNLFIAKLNCSYQPTYSDMVGFARLNRGWIVIETMPSVARERWTTFVVGLKLEDRVEFGVGDLGLAGGLRIFSIVTYVVSTITFMLNLLIAQLDMVGFARLNRGYGWLRAPESWMDCDCDHAFGRP